MEMEVVVKEERKREKHTTTRREKPLSVIKPRRPSLSLLPPPSKPAADSQFSDISDASDGEGEKRMLASPPEPSTTLLSQQQPASFVVAQGKLPNGLIPTILTPSSDLEDKSKLPQQPSISSLPSFDAVRSPQPQISREDKDQLPVKWPSTGISNQEVIPDSQPTSPKDTPSSSSLATVRSSLLSAYPSPSLGPHGVASLTCSSMQDQRHGFAGSQPAGKSKTSSALSPKQPDMSNPLNTLADMAVVRSAHRGRPSSSRMSSESSSSREDDGRREGGDGDDKTKIPQTGLYQKVDGTRKPADKNSRQHTVPSMIKPESVPRATLTYCPPRALSPSASKPSEDTHDSDSSGSGSLSPCKSKKIKGHKEKRKGGGGGVSGGPVGGRVERGPLKELSEAGKEDTGRPPGTPALGEVPFNFHVPGLQPISPGGDASSTTHGDPVKPNVSSTASSSPSSSLTQYSVAVLQEGRNSKASPCPADPSPWRSFPNQSHSPPHIPTEREPASSMAPSSSSKKTKVSTITSFSSGPVYPPPIPFMSPSLTGTYQAGMPTVIFSGNDMEKDRQKRKRKAQDAAVLTPSKRPSSPPPPPPPLPPPPPRESDGSKPLRPLPASLAPPSKPHPQGGAHFLTGSEFKSRENLPGFEFDPSLPMPYHYQVLAYEQQMKHQMVVDHSNKPSPPAPSAPKVVPPKRPRSTDPSHSRPLIRNTGLPSPPSTSSSSVAGYRPLVEGGAATMPLLNPARVPSFPTASIAQPRPKHPNPESTPGRSHGQVRPIPGQPAAKKPNKKPDLAPVQIKQDPDTQVGWYQHFSAIPQAAAAGIQLSPHFVGGLPQLPQTPPSSSQPPVASPMAGVPQMPSLHFSPWAPGVIAPNLLHVAGSKSIKHEQPSPMLVRPTPNELVPPHRTRSPSPALTKKPVLSVGSGNPDHHPIPPQVIIPTPTRPVLAESKSSRSHFSSDKLTSSSSHAHGASSSSSSLSSARVPHASKMESPMSRPQQTHLQPHPSLPQPSPTHSGMHTDFCLGGGGG